MVDHNLEEFNKRLKALYPTVDEEESPLPRKWSHRDKFTFITLSQDNLKVQYVGQGKNHRDAASVRATNPIPTSCGVYYFEVKIVSKGRDGYMGIGLSAQGVSLNRLPGWDKLTYGYHGDDGHKFCSTGNGQPYGPTFTTGDVIGCCLNLVTNSCFYTKNGIHIGDAFQDLPAVPLYPTVGLQTPNEEVMANFGQQEFMFDFDDYILEWRKSTQAMIYKHVPKDGTSQVQNMLHRLVASYLVHHGYVASTEAFNQSISQSFSHCERLSSIRNRQKIKKLVLAGRIGEAIEFTEQMFPNLLTNNPNLLFLLKVRQFIEMVNGTDSEIKSISRNPSISSGCSPNMSPKQGIWGISASNSPASSHNSFSPPLQRPQHQQYRSLESTYSAIPSGEPMNLDYERKPPGSSSASDSDMDTDSDDGNRHENVNGTVSNGVAKENFSNGNGVDRIAGGDSHSVKLLCGGNPLAVERMLQFGQQLLKLAKEIKIEHPSVKNKRILKDAYSLLAYTDPWNSPVGYQLDPVQREPVCTALNSAILESQNLPTRPPLLTIIAQAKQCIKKMLHHKIGAAAFVSVSDYLS